jgi:hypothetical protein
MAERPDISWLISALRGPESGTRLDPQLRALTDSLNAARRQAESEGQDDAGIFGAMRREWEGCKWEVRYAHLLAAAAQWFTVSAQHNFDRVPIPSRIASGDTISNMLLVAMVIGLPELERAFDHAPGVHPEERGRSEGEACDCFGELVYRMKLGSFINIESGDWEGTSAQKGEA